MKVEHLTALTGHTAMRDTDDILLPTRHHFTGVLPAGKNPVAIPGTTLSLMLTVEWPVAIFTLFKGKTPLLTNVCCYTPAGRETALQMAGEVMKGGPLGKDMGPLRPPAGDLFLITVPVLPFASPQEMMLAGEIELYLYYAIYERYRP